MSRASQTRQPLRESPGNGSIHARIKSIESNLLRETKTVKIADEFSSENLSPRRSYETGLQRMGTLSRGGHQHPGNLLESSDIEKLGKSSTPQLRHLSKFANNNDADFAIRSAEEEVAGLHGRRRLQRIKDNSTRAPGYGGRTWMDQQRQFLQAYEYLCHIGEAKEWIEDVIQCPIAPIVQLEEALRNGVVLAEIVQALKPHAHLRIFRHEKLQFRHSDNIAIFFNFLAEVELPDLFRFETVDLYEKKNIPKVIYCIHALSWVLLRKGLVDFQMGNLVGMLEFEDHELEATQKGLDQAGVSMPNFSSMRQDFGAEPEPEPMETEDERIARELSEQSDSVTAFQAQARSWLERQRASDLWYELQDQEDAVIVLQSRIRGNFARQISSYRLGRQQWATRLQSISRGFIIREQERQRNAVWTQERFDISRLQNALRAQKVRKEIKKVRFELSHQQSSVIELQAALRGSFIRKQARSQREATQRTVVEAECLQAHIRGMLERQRCYQDRASLVSASAPIVKLQALIRGSQSRTQVNAQQDRLLDNGIEIEHLQAILRGQALRAIQTEVKAELAAHKDEFMVLQAHVRGSKSRKAFESIKGALELQSGPFTELQTIVRGNTVRQEIYQQLLEFQEHEDTITEIQSILRGQVVRSYVADTLESLEEDEESVLELQSHIRGMIVRQRFAEKQRHFRENMSKVIKIQSFVRGRQQGQAYKSLTTGKNPPVNTVKNFVHLLNDSDFDFEEEVESEKLRKAVGSRVRENEQIQQWIDELDAKIGLLAHNKIARDEYAKMQKHYGGNSLSINRSMSSRDSFNLKALNKTSRAKLELYQELMFLLQTQPRYFARLFRLTREKGATDSEYKRLEMLVNSAFGYTQKRREEYYLLKLIAEAISEEVKGCGSLSDFVRGNFFFSRLFTSYTRSPRDRKYIREIIGTLVKTQILDNMHLDLESDPLTIYRTAINDEELSTGRRSSRNKDVSREEAIRDPQTRDAFIHHLQDMRDIVDHFLLLLEEALPRMPYGTRYVAATMFESLRENFAREDPATILQTVGNWVWKTYIRPLLADPEHFGLVDRQLDARQKRNLNELTKVISQAASGKLFGSENVYLQPLNSYMTEAIGRMADIYARVIEVKDLETQFDYDEYADLHAKVKPTLHIKAADVFAVHRIIADDVLHLCRGPDDAALREVIRELGSAKANEAEMSAGSAEVTLSLSSKNVHSFDDPDADTKALFLETKRCVLYIIRVQAGADLLDVMVKPITNEDEARWAQLVSEELSAGSTRRGAYSDGSTNLLDIASMSYSEMKSIALENMLALQQRGKLLQDNHYQDLLNEIAIDIRQKHKRRIQRQRELENVRGTLIHLEEKAKSLEETLKAYNDTFEQNLNVLQNKKGKKRFINPFGKQADHERELAKQGRTPTYGSFKYSGESLAEKGILIEWRGRDLRRDDIVIASDQVNQFTIDGMSGHMMVPGAHDSFSWDDLLDAQYQGQRHLKFFAGVDGSAHGELILDTNLFMQQVSKKFWPEG